VASIVVVLDANVLYGINLTDLLLTIATKRLFRAHWSPLILEEVRRNLALRTDLLLSAVDDRLAQMNRALPGASTDVPEKLIDAMPVNTKDRHVLALAVHLAAPIIVTHNLRDFPNSLCAPLGVEALSPDQFVTLQIGLDPTAVLRAVDEIAHRRKRAPKTANDIIDDLRETLPATASLLRSLSNAREESI
jgi:predicted nucleic acid-binding protein